MRCEPTNPITATAAKSRRCGCENRAGLCDDLNSNRVAAGASVGVHQFNPELVQAGRHLRLRDVDAAQMAIGVIDVRDNLQVTG